jgi:hypothetical protein
MRQSRIPARRERKGQVVAAPSDRAASSRRQGLRVPGIKGSRSGSRARRSGARCKAGRSRWVHTFEGVFAHFGAIGTFIPCRNPPPLWSWRSMIQIIGTLRPPGAGYESGRWWPIAGQARLRRAD